MADHLSPGSDTDGAKDSLLRRQSITENNATFFDPRAAPDPNAPGFQPTKYDWNNGPRFLNFEGFASDSGQLNTYLFRAQQGWIEVLRLAVAAKAAVACQNPAFSRYFDAADQPLVASGLDTILGSDGKGPVEMSQDLSNPFNIIYANNKFLPDPTHNACLKDQALGAFFQDWQASDGGIGPTMYLCPSLFTRTRKALSWWACDTAPPFSAPQYDTIGKLMFHEMVSDGMAAF